MAVGHGQGEGEQGAIHAVTEEEEEEKEVLVV